MPSLAALASWPKLVDCADYDAVRLAAADRVRDPNVVVIAGDGVLLDAAAAEGMAVAAIP